MGLFLRLFRFLWARWADYNSAIAILDFFDWKTGLFAIVGGLAMTFFGALNLEWSPQAVVLAALAAAAFVAIIVVAVRFVFMPPPYPVPPVQQQPDIASTTPLPDIDGRVAFFEILEKSEWRAKQLANAPDPRTVRSDWLRIRLSTEIHNYLAQDRLAAWGETSLSHGTGPQRRIKPEEWEQSEILFDELNPHFPRTIARWRTNDRASLFGIMFSKEHVFQMFPPAIVQAQTESEMISLLEAATRAYEAAEEAGILDLTTSTTASPETKLDHFKLLFMVDNETEVFGVKPPSTKARLIPKADLQGHDLYPETGENSQINHLVPADRIAYTNVTLRRKDLRRVVDGYIAEARRIPR